jgi:peptidoglycan/LPS O-acetylase OafA/YrhL
MAIVLVLAEHFFGTPGVEIGRMGVDVFFALSGLLMARILFEKRMPLGAFYVRRASRILPTFLLFTLVAYGVWGQWSDAADRRSLLGSLLFVRTYLTADTFLWDDPVPIGHFWSLHVEEHAYMLLGLLALVAKTRRAATVALSAAVAATLLARGWYAVAVDVQPPGFDLRTECAAFGLFAAAAWRLLVGERSLPGAAWLAPLALVAATACYTQGLPFYFASHAGPALLAIGVVHLGEAVEPMRRLFSLRWLRALGVASFSLYLWQQPFYMHNEALGRWTALGLALVVGLVSFWCFEDPVRRWINERFAAES